MSEAAFTLDTMNATMMETAKLIHGYFTKTKKGYALIDQRWMLDKLQKWHGLTRSRRALCYNLRLLENGGYIRRTQRHRTNPTTGAFEPRVTLLEMTWKLRAVFSRLASYFRGIGWRDLITKAVKDRRARAAQRAALETTALPMSREDNLAAVRALRMSLEAT